MADEQIGAVLQSIATAGGNTNQLLGKLIETLSGLFPFSGDTGTFTCAAAASTTIPNPNIAVNSIILLMPTNAAAGTLMGSAKSFYISRTADISFAVTTANGAAAAGNETFSYIVINPSG